MSSKDVIQLSVVVPCYRSGNRLRELVERTRSTLSSLSISYEILLIHDASGNETWSAIKEVSALYDEVRGIDLLYNVGQFKATLCGMEHAQGEMIATMDDDLQHPPEELPKLVNALRSSPDMDCVIGAYKGKKHSWLRNAGSSLMAFMNQHLYKTPRGLKRSSFRIMRRTVSEAICSHTTSKPIIGPLILQATNRIANVYVEHHGRQEGRSGYNLLRLLRISLDNLFSVSTFPLKVVSVVGMCSAAGSCMLAIYYLLRYFVGAIGAPGFVTIVLLITFFGGMTLLSIGILGEYVIRVIREVSHPPRYTIREQT